MYLFESVVNNISNYTKKVINGGPLPQMMLGGNAVAAATIMAMDGPLGLKATFAAAHLAGGLVGANIFSSPTPTQYEGPRSITQGP